MDMQLSPQQTQNLIHFIIEDYGIDLSADQFGEALGLVSEDIPGLESFEPQDLSQWIEQAFLLYCQLTHRSLP